MFTLLTSWTLETNLKSVKCQQSCCVAIFVVLHGTAVGKPPGASSVLGCGHQLQPERGAPGRGKAQLGKAARGGVLLTLDLLSDQHRSAIQTGRSGVLVFVALGSLGPLEPGLEISDSMS